MYYAFAAKEAGIYAQGDLQGQPYEVGTMMTADGRTIVARTLEEAQRWKCAALYDVVEITELPERVIWVSEWAGPDKDNVLRDLRRSLDHLLSIQEAAKSREKALAITNLEQAIMWLERDPA